MRSSKSQITFVGYDADLDVKLDTAYGTTSEGKAFTWSDHLLAVFCVRRRGRYIPTTARRSSEPEEDEVYKLIPIAIEGLLTQPTGPLPFSMGSRGLCSFISKG